MPKQRDIAKFRNAVASKRPAIHPVNLPFDKDWFYQSLSKYPFKASKIFTCLVERTREIADGPYLHEYVNCRHESGFTPLILSVYLNQTTATSQLIRWGANFIEPDNAMLHRKKDKISLVRICVDTRSPGLLGQILSIVPRNELMISEKGILVHAINEHGDSGWSLYRVLLTNGAMVSDIDEDGNTTLHAALSTKAVSTSRYLYSKGVNPNIKNNVGQTPLHLLCMGYDKDAMPIIMEAISYGANPHVADNMGASPVEILLSKGLKREAIQMGVLFANYGKSELRSISGSSCK